MYDNNTTFYYTSSYASRGWVALYDDHGSYFSIIALDHFVEAGSPSIHAYLTSPAPTNWTDPTQLTFKSADGTYTYYMQSAKHMMKYIPVSEWYDERQVTFDNVIKKDYHWCESGKSVFSYESTSMKLSPVDFTCLNNVFSDAKFGLLTTMEYNAITKRYGNVYMYDIAFDAYAGGDLPFDHFYSTSYLAFSDKSPGSHGCRSWSNSLVDCTTNLRPAIVLKGDLIIESGSGTNDNPYVLKTD